MFKTNFCIFLIFLVFQSSAVWASFIYIPPQTNNKEVEEVGVQESYEKIESAAEKIESGEKHAPSYKSKINKAGLDSMGVVQIGKGDFKATTSFGENVPLSIAMGMIKPKEWSVDYDESIKPVKDLILISWDIKDQPWVDALDSVSVKNVNFVVSWPYKTIFIGKGVEENIETVRVLKDKEYDLSKEEESFVQSENILVLEEELGPLTLDAGKVSDSLVSWCDEWGYSAIFRGSKEVDRLSLTHPMNLSGKSFQKDLAIISRDLNNAQGFVFRFSVYEKNNVLEIEVARK